MWHIGRDVSTSYWHSEDCVDLIHNRLGCAAQAIDIKVCVGHAKDDDGEEAGLANDDAHGVQRNKCSWLLLLTHGVPEDESASLVDAEPQIDQTRITTALCPPSHSQHAHGRAPILTCRSSPLPFLIQVHTSPGSNMNCMPSRKTDFAHA